MPRVDHASFTPPPPPPPPPRPPPLPLFLPDPFIGREIKQSLVCYAAAALATVAASCCGGPTGEHP